MIPWDAVLILAAAGVLLWLGAEWLVKGAAAIAKQRGLSPMIVGATIVAFGTSAPELFTTLSAQLGKQSDMATGNIIGSNVANLGLALGLTAIVLPVAFSPTLLKRELPLVLVAEILFLVLAQDGVLGRLDGVILLTFFFALYVYLLRASLGGERQQDEDGPSKPSLSIRREVLLILIGLAGLALGAHLFVAGAETIAARYGIPPLIVGVTIVAIGTSLPEVITSLVGALRGEPDLSLGNLLGSNFFNILLVGGLMTLIRPVEVGKESVFHLWWMIGITAALFPAAWLARGKSRFGRPAGFLLFAGYVWYMVECVLAVR